MTPATCATLAAILAAAQPGATVRLVGDCKAVRIARVYAPALVIEAYGSTVRGVTIPGGGIVWRGGTIRAPGGVDGAGPLGYGALVTGRDVTFEGVRFIDSNRAIVGNGAVNLAVRFSRFELGQDGVIAAGGSGLDVSHNGFVSVSFKPTSCTVGAVVTSGLSRAACKGVWRDGYHQDAIQIRNGIVGVRIIGNTIDGVQQGIGEMNAATDKPLADVDIDGNDVAVSGFHSISIGKGSLPLRIVGNKVRQTTGRRTTIRVWPGGVVCGNDVAKLGDPGGGAC